MKSNLDNTNRSETPLVFNKKIRPKPSKVYNAYWYYAAERQEIFYKRVNNEAYPWTSDPILNHHKFTNTYRAADRVSQFLIRNVIYHGDQCPNELFFRIILFKIFNRIDTWKFLEDILGEISFRDYSFERYNQALSSLMNAKLPIYSAAYIMASGKSRFGWEKKHQNHLRMIEMMISDKLPSSVQDCSTMNEVYDLLISYPTIGDFLGYQFATDINYSNLTDFSEMEFVKAGPGAKDGIAKCFTDFGDYSFEDIIKMMVDIQENEFERLGIDFKNLWGRALQLIDCQNLFCEIDKYSRVAFPDVPGYSHRTKIKQNFSLTNKEKISYFFPPKWNINHLI